MNIIHFQPSDSKKGDRLVTSNIKDIISRLFAPLDKILRNKYLFLAVFGLISVPVYVYITYPAVGLLYAIDNGLFLLGLLYLMLGLGTYIRNVGLFKAFRYVAYKVRAGAYGAKKGQVYTMNLAEYTMEITSEKNRVSGKPYYMYAFPLLAVSALMAFVIMS